MNRIIITIIVAVIANCGLFSANASADQTIAAGPLRRAVDTINPLNWSMPDWKLPSMKGMFRSDNPMPTNRGRNQGLMAGIKRNTRKGWEATKKTLHPQNFNPLNWLGSEDHAPKKRSAVDQTIWPNLYTDDSKREPSVSDFLSQERVGF